VELFDFSKLRSSARKLNDDGVRRFQLLKAFTSETTWQYFGDGYAV
jgi:hypothetical protein